MAYDPAKWLANERRSGKRSRWLPWALLAAMLIIAAMAVLETFDNGVEPREIARIWPFLLVIILAGPSPFARDTWLGRRADREFDEFELAALSRATTRAYSVLTSLLCAIVAWLWLARIFDWPVPRTPLDWSSLAFAILAITAGLPTLCAELMVPLPPDEDASDD